MSKSVVSESNNDYKSRETSGKRGAGDEEKENEEGKIEALGAETTTTSTSPQTNAALHAALPTPTSIALCVNSLYSSLPNRGKPPPNSGEWTVLSALLCYNKSTQNLHVVSLATGSKCCGPSLIKSNSESGGGGRVLHDSHAEVLTRRGFVYAILREINETTNDTNNTDGSSTSSSTPSSLKRPLLSSKSPPILNPDLSFHLYISESPCGDAAIYPISDPDADADEVKPTTNFTGAKIITSSSFTSTPPSSTPTTASASASASSPTLSSNQQQILKTTNEQITLTREPTIQSLSSLRLKSGRSSLLPSQRSLSHSCSDKILRWCELGLTGSLSPLKIYLSSVVCGRDPQAKLKDQELALIRAVKDRGDKTNNCTVSVVQNIFDSSRMVKKKNHKKISASGQSINYNHFDEGKGKGGHHHTEVTVGATGALQAKGKKKSKKRSLNSVDDVDEIAAVTLPTPSRLSRRSLMELSLRANGLESSAKSYNEIKTCLLTSEEYRKNKDDTMKGVLKGWVCSGEANDFMY